MSTRPSTRLSLAPPPLRKPQKALRPRSTSESPEVSEDSDASEDLGNHQLEPSALKAANRLLTITIYMCAHTQLIPRSSEISEFSQFKQGFLAEPSELSKGLPYPPPHSKQVPPPMPLEHRGRYPSLTNLFNLEGYVYSLAASRDSLHLVASLPCG